MAYINFDPQDYFNTKLWTGDGTSSRSQTGVGFQPDFVWIKRRNDAASHTLYDVVRGAGSTKGLATNSTAQEGLTATEGTTANFGYVNSFDSDGFTTSNGATSDVYVNNSSATYASWNWLANNTSGSSNTDGSITTTVSANTTSGFSIIQFTGTGANASIGHGLGTIPHFLIFKRYNDSGFNWFCYHRSLGAGKFMTLDTTLAVESSTTIWQNTTPTSSLITLSGAGGVNGSGGTYICYAFAEKKGYSKIGSYTGNGSADGTFVYTGFKPAFVLFKPSSAVENWQIHDNKRPGYNPCDNIAPNNSSAEATTNDFVDLVSNGFKLRSATYSASSVTYIYMAFAENPLINSLGNPATAG